MTQGITEIDRLKHEMRLAQRKQRAVLFKAAPAAIYVKAARHFIENIEIPSGGVVAGYWPLNDEFDSRPLLESIAAEGGRLALPVVAGDSGRLIFREWLPGAPLVPAGFGTLGPRESAREVLPDVIIAPLLAFDRRGYRLGYGGGFYDRSLTALRASGKCQFAAGLGFAAQRVQQVPAGLDDARLDAVVTETGIIRARTAGGPDGG
ncbi:MAG: 5-formyltetrahydrofolate cyclo-ligase [Alphaproteobacteria bacterium]